MAFDKAMVFFLIFFLFASGIGISAQSCGGTYSSTWGVFMSPNYPNSYDTNSQCVYNILLSTNSSLTINFETFELDRPSGDYVTISCESNSSYGQKKYTWNYNIPPISFPWCSYGRVYFFSDTNRSYSTRGFKVQYQANTEGCGRTVFTSSSGNILSPKYPQDYNNNENCTYSIWAPGTSSFTLTFEAFHLESVSDCRYDWVQIRCDNSSYISPKYCGSTIPKPAFISNCTKVLIWFRTDQAKVFSGFSLRYSFTSDGCGKLTYGGLSGVITSPNYPKGYTGTSCTYLVYPVSSLALAFQSFDLEPFIDSSYGDYVRIACYSNSSSGYHYYRGNTLPPLISYTLCSRVGINFYPNAAISGTGFNLKYQVNPLAAHSAITHSPKSFSVDAGSRVELDCTSNATGYYPSWTLSKDGTDEDTTVIASFCVLNSDYVDTYDVVKDGPGVCDLVITSVNLATAGVYTCIDVSLASASSVVTVVDQSDSDVVVIVLAVLLAISILSCIGVVIFFVVRRRRETQRQEEGQPSSDSVKIQATGSVYVDPPIHVVLPESSTTITENDERGYEHLKQEFDNIVAYEALKGH